jgi:hypothetical protein
LSNNKILIYYDDLAKKEQRDAYFALNRKVYKDQFSDCDTIEAAWYFVSMCLENEKWIVFWFD